MKSPFLILTAIFISATLGLADNSENSGPTYVPAPSANAPLWAKLVLSGATVTAYYATGAAAPTTWTQIGQPQTINFANSSLLIGMAVTAHNATAITSGTVDNFTISPATNYRLADTDIGAPGLMGSANLVNNVWTLSGSGADIWGGYDQFNFQPWLVGGDCTVTCRITSISAGGDPWEKVGLMVRDTYGSGSDYAMICGTLGNGVDFEYRHGPTVNNDQAWYVAPPPANTTYPVAVGIATTGTTAYQLRP
jgi:hypothetical protein